MFHEEESRGVAATAEYKYKVLRPLGVGGMATVHLAEEKGTRQKVALKQLHPFIASDPASVKLLEQEARLLGCIRHQNVVGVIDFVEDTGLPAPTLVMEYVDGVNLSFLIAAAKDRGVTLPIDVTARIVCDLLSGLHAAHEATRADGSPLEIVHRDVSPQNVIVGVDGVARLTDFGIARALWRLEVTKLGVVKGKLGYMAPEQLEGRCDRRSDVYAAGVVLWELLTGTRFRSLEGEATQVLVQVLHGLASAPSTIAPEARILDEIVMRALARDSFDRFETAQEMADALAAHIAPASSARVAEVYSQLLLTKSPSSSDESRDASAVNEVAATIDLALDNPTSYSSIARESYVRELACDDDEEVTVNERLSSSQVQAAQVKTTEDRPSGIRPRVDIVRSGPTLVRAQIPLARRAPTIRHVLTGRLEPPSQLCG
jgi:eukaryotic-like serine/threonine-protein kinase